MPKKILIADDNHSQLSMLQAFLQERGYAVISAGDGEEALEKGVKEKPDLIILDVQMPVMEGDEAAMHLRSKKETQDIPILFVTGLRTEKEIQENHEENIFAKPVALDALLKKITDLIGN